MQPPDRVVESFQFHRERRAAALTAEPRQDVRARAATYRSILEDTHEQVSLLLNADNPSTLEEGRAVLIAQAEAILEALRE